MGIASWLPDQTSRTTSGCWYCRQRQCILKTYFYFTKLTLIKQQICKWILSKVMCCLIGQCCLYLYCQWEKIGDKFNYFYVMHTLRNCDSMFLIIKKLSTQSEMSLQPPSRRWWGVNWWNFIFGWTIRSMTLSQNTILHHHTVAIIYCVSKCWYMPTIKFRTQSELKVMTWNYYKIKKQHL